ncbi:hypothetical protein DPEC_G00038550 [Dallia pectoralis]|uniref:Uncharacterized protein n=1 Tax=Dallia pectoralis TaxID=75939 RepID=A0ACC2HFJ8_DALPE|nr:hypothetical protein DPEC_G00038550 [Dallia pectoralis]
MCCQTLDCVTCYSYRLCTMPMRDSLPLLLCNCCVLLLFHQVKGQGHVGWRQAHSPSGDEGNPNLRCMYKWRRSKERGRMGPWLKFHGLRCDPGWEGQECDMCVRMPGCVHGSCHQPWQCNCQPGWAGRFCDKDIHVCTNEAPCQNGATCYTNISGEYTCLCPDNFHGRNCEHKTGLCYRSGRSPCKNGGQCEDSSGHALELSCRCLAGFTGPRCETNIDDCLMRPCANGATCQDGINRFSCVCPGGFEGRFCTVNLNDCASQPCLNGGRCLDGAGTFHCLCTTGFTGRTCDIQRVPENHATIRSSQEWPGGGGEGAGVTQARPDQITARANHTQSYRPPKISVKEVVTWRGSSGLSEVQLIIVLVLGGMTLAVVALTAVFVLRGHRQGGCRWSPAPRPDQQGCRDTQSPRQSRLMAGEPECKISYLHTPTTPELEKKKLNTVVI